MATLENRFWSKVDVRGADECWPWLASTNEHGYGQFYANGKNRKAHQVAYELENGPVPAGKEVCHNCDNRACCNPRHLEAATHAKNIKDTHVRGRRAGVRLPKGEDHPNAGLSDAEVAEALRLVAAGVEQKDVAARFGVHPTTISKYVRGLRRAA